MKTALFFKLLFVCLACVAIRPVSAQVLGAGVFELKGQVVDSLTNEPVSFATLRVTRGEEITEPLALLACDIDGYFSVSLPEAGSPYEFYRENTCSEESERFGSIARMERR